MLAVSLIEKEVSVVTFLMGFSGTKYKPWTVQGERRKHGPAVLLQALRGTPRINTTTPTYKIYWCAKSTALHQQVTLGLWARSMFFFFRSRRVTTLTKIYISILSVTTKCGLWWVAEKRTASTCSALTDLDVEILFVPILLGFKELCPGVRENSIRDIKYPGFVFPYDVSDNADENATFSRREKTSLRLRKPSTGHKQKGTGQEEVNM